MADITGTKLFDTGEVLASADVNRYLMRGVKVFADAATRDAAYGGAGEPDLEEGEVVYLEDSNDVATYDGAAWRSLLSGLVPIMSQTIGTAVSVVPVTGAFSADYLNYRIVISGGTSSTLNDLRLTYGASTASYYWSWTGTTWGDSASKTAGSNVAFAAIGNGSTNGLFAVCDVIQPFATVRTTTVGNVVTMGTGNAGYTTASFHNVAASYTDFTITASTGTLTGGTIKVYGYRN